MTLYVRVWDLGARKTLDKGQTRHPDSYQWRRQGDQQAPTPRHIENFIIPPSYRLKTPQKSIFVFRPSPTIGMRKKSFATPLPLYSFPASYIHKLDSSPRTFFETNSSPRTLSNMQKSIPKIDTPSVSFYSAY